MSSAAEFQKLIFDTLKANAAVMALANGVYDNIPASPFGSKTAYISFGPVDTNEDDAEEIVGIETTLQIDVWSRAVGAVECKRLTDLVRKALHKKSLALTDNALVDVWVPIYRVMRDPDGVTTHGVVQVSAMIEEPA